METKKILKGIKNGVYVLSAVSGGYLVTYQTLISMSNKEASKNDGSPENTIGYNNVKLLNNDTVNTNNFVILHVKRDDDVKELREKIEFCENNNISVGLVLDTEASDLVTIYQDVDFLQAIVKEYKIDFPVYFNIESLMANKDLNVAQRKEIMNSFIDKMSRSDMYFGFYGKDSSLCECNENVLDMQSYDCFVVKENETINFDGTATLIQNLDGTIIAKEDLSKVILEKQLNSAKKLVYSATYKVKENDTYHSVALNFGLSENDLRSYNNVGGKEELTLDQIITIPNLYKSINTTTGKIDYNYAVARGIDISDYQVNIDWQRVKETSDYVIVEVARDPGNYEVNNGSYINECANQIKNVVQNDLGLGLYFCVSKDMKISVYEQRIKQYFEQLENDLKTNNTKLDRSNVPVFLDFEEYYEYNDYYKLMEMFDKVCKEHGFTKIGIYGNSSTLKAVSSSLEKDGEHIEIKDTDWYVWKSGGEQYSSNENYDEGITVEELIEPKNESNSQFTPDVLQVTNVCKDTGASNSFGNCDVNYCYTYDLFGIENQTEQYETIQYVAVDLDKYTKTNAKTIVNAVSSALVGLGLVMAVVEVVGRNLIIGVKKKKEKQKKL